MDFLKKSRLLCQRVFKVFVIAEHDAECIHSPPARILMHVNRFIGQPKYTASHRNA
jgi:hypothetical protein